jgi:hypothetical protein
MHPLIAAQLAQQLVDQWTRTASETRRRTADAAKGVTPQRQLVEESLLRVPPREGRT